MKKTLALVLAAALALGMSTVAFASSSTKTINIDTTNVYTYSDDSVMTAVSISDGLAANTTYYLHVTGGATSANLGDEISKLSELTTNYKVRTTIEDGSAYIATKPAFVIKTDKASGSVKKAYITFTTADKFNMEDVDLDMDIGVYPSDTGYEIYLDSGAQTVDTSTPATITTFNSSSVGYGITTAQSYFRVDRAEPVVEFDNVDDDVEIEFGDDNEEVTFVVDGASQKDLFLRMDTTNDALEDKYPEAVLEIRSFAGNNKTFRKTGVLTIPADATETGSPYLYEIVSGKLSLCSDAKYDTDTEAFTLKTNKLGSYVVSDTKLSTSTTVEDTTSTTSDEETSADGAEENPDTGANDFVGLAVALSVVAIAGIAVAKRR